MHAHLFHHYVQVCQMVKHDRCRSARIIIIIIICSSTIQHAPTDIIGWSE
jgi:hypothetical protein